MNRNFYSAIALLLIVIALYSCERNAARSNAYKSKEISVKDAERKSPDIVITAPVVTETTSPVTIKKNTADVPVVIATEKNVDSTDDIPESPALELKAVEISEVAIRSDKRSISETRTVTRLAGISPASESSAYSTEDEEKAYRTISDPVPMARDEIAKGEKDAGSLSPASSTNAALAGKLTAGEINDFQKWKMWTDISENELKVYRNIWTIDPQDRYSVLVQSTSGNPIVDCEVELVLRDGSVSWKTRTDNTGKAELWNNMDMNVGHKDPDQIRVRYMDKVSKIDRPVQIGQGINNIRLQTGCDIPDALDLLFTVDATGSMGDEIAYLQAELVDVVNKVKEKHKDVSMRLGSVFYRDHGDTYVTQKSPFNTDVNVTSTFIARQFADGGGDGPEAVDDAFASSIDEMKWSDRARARLMFVILDAPPHSEKQFIDKMKIYIRKAADKGVRIIPLVASGGGYDVDKSLEYLMRCCALATNGTYAFLTDHSGVGGSHTAPSTDKYDVETLNALLLRIIEQFLYVPACNVLEFIDEQEVTDTTSVSALIEIPADTLSSDSTVIQVEPVKHDILIMKCYPNPATDHLWVETSEQVREMFLADNSGKIMQRIVPNTNLTRLDLTDYPTGIYHLKAWINERWSSAQIVVAHQ